MERPCINKATMDQIEETKITISTHNVNGYNRSKEFIWSLCDENKNSIRALQEHWLQPPYKKQQGVNQLRVLHPDFDGFGVSAMKKAAKSKIVKGRPFGGTGFVYNKKYAKCLKPLLDYEHERVTVMRLENAPFNILLINIYFPYCNSSDLSTHVALYRDTIGFVENVIAQNTDCKIMLLADLNYDIYNDNHPFTSIVRGLMDRHNLISAFETIENFDHVSSFTRFDVKTNSYTLIDGILISKELREFISNVRIVSRGDNVSDHCPVELDIKVKIVKMSLSKPTLPQYVNWRKLSEGDLSCFRDAMANNLASIDIPYHAILHGDKCCFDDSHKLVLEKYYCGIMNAVIKAENLLPKTNPNYDRSFWDNELSDLKTRSIECDRFWKSLGCPKNGPAYDCRKSCHYIYKSKLRQNKRNAEKDFSESMYADLMNKNGISFWQKWSHLNSTRDSLVTWVNGETDPKGIADTFADYFKSVYSDHDTTEHKLLKRDFENAYSQFYLEHSNDNISPYLLTWPQMVDLISKLKPGKSSSGACKPEHFLHGCPEL